MTGVEAARAGACPWAGAPIFDLCDLSPRPRKTKEPCAPVAKRLSAGTDMRSPGQLKLLSRAVSNRPQGAKP